MTPDTYTNQEFFLDVGNGHQLYVQDWGNKANKVPIIFLHGGPGSGCKDKHKQLFDPEQQHVIFFDQRGAGKSLPYGSLEHNTTADLVGDIEKLADRLKLEQFILSGGSWGSTLALAFALKHPKRVKALVLNGIFTGSQIEIDWLKNGGFREFFPEIWAAYLAETPKSQHANPSAYHFKRALGNDRQAAKASAYTYSNLEGALLSLDDRFTPETFADFDETASRIEIHYLAKRCFLPDRHILDNAHALTMPVWLVQGRYDFACPPKTASELQAALPDSQLVWTISGHRMEHDTWNMMRTILLQLTRE